MGVSKKGRRQITYKDREYVWYVEEDGDYPCYCLNIVSDDKHLIISLPLGLDEKYVISKGKRFQNNKTSGCWERFEYPFELPEIITPKIVADIIDWAEYDIEAVKIDFNGKIFPI